MAKKKQTKPKPVARKRSTPISTKKPPIQDVDKPFGFYETDQSPSKKQPLSRPVSFYKVEKPKYLLKNKPSKPFSHYSQQETTNLPNNEPEISKELTPKSVETPGENPVKNVNTAKSIEESAEMVEEIKPKKPPLDGTRPPTLDYQGPKSPDQIQDVDFSKSQKTYESGRPHLFEFEKNAAKNISSIDSKVPSKINSSPLEELIERFNVFKSLPSQIKSAGKFIAPAAIVGEGVDATRNFQSALNDNNLNEYQKWGKGLKGVGGSVAAGAAATELATGLGASPLAIPVGLAGTGLYGIGEGLEYYGDPARVQQRQQEEKNKNKLTRDFAHFLDTSAPEAFKGKLVPSDYVPHRYERDIFRKNRLNEMTDEELMNITKEQNRSPSGARRLQVFAPKGFTPPAKGEIVNYIIDRAKQFGEDPAEVLAQIEHESGGFKLGAESKTGAQGLGQMFKPAYEDAKAEDKEGVLKNLTYEDVHSNIANWKPQIDASILYNKKIRNNYNKSGTYDEQRLRYLAGTGNVDLDHLREQFKQGKLSSDPDEYLNKTQQLKEKWNNILNNEEAKKESLANRSPAELDSTINVKDDARTNLVKFLRASTDEEKRQAMDRLFPPQLVLETTPYEEDRRKEDIARVMSIKDKYDASSASYEDAKQKMQTEQPVETESEPSPQADSTESNFSDDISKIFKAEQGYTESTRQNLKNVQDEANRLRMMNLFMQGASQAGRGIAGAMSGYTVKPDEPFKALSEQADTLEEQFKQSVALQSDDPNSQASASARNIASVVLDRLGVPDKSILNNMSERAIYKVMPQLAEMQQVQQRLSQAKEQKREVQDTKRFDKMATEIVAEKASARSTFGTDSRTLAATQNIRLLLTPPGQKPPHLMTPEEKADYLQNKDRYLQEQEEWLNGLDTREQYEVAKALDRVLSQTGATISGTEKLTPKTLRAWFSKAAEYLFNTRFGAGGSDFMKRFQNNLDREEEVAMHRIKNVQKKVLAPYKDLKKVDPQKWNLIMKMNNLPEDPFEEEKISIPQEDSDIRDLANRKFNGNYDIARQWLISTGQLK